MTAPLIAGPLTYQTTDGLSMTVDTSALTPNAGDLFHFVLAQNDAGVGPIDFADPFAGWSLKHGNGHGVGTAAIHVWEHIVRNPASEGETVFSWTEARDALGLLIRYHPGQLASGGYISADRSGTNKLNMGTINPPVGPVDTRYMQYWAADYVSSIANSGNFARLGILKHTTGDLTLAAYHRARLASDSLTPQTDVLDPTVDTRANGQAVNWVGIGAGIY